MKARKGIKLLLEPKTRIRDWIRYQTLNVEIGWEYLGKRKVRFLKIRKGEAEFNPGGYVSVKMPGSDEFRVAFRPIKVLEIRDLRGNLIERNHYLCVECGTLTCFRLVDEIVECTQCGCQRKLRGR